MVGAWIPSLVPISEFIFLIARISSSIRYLALLSSSISLLSEAANSLDAEDLLEGVADFLES
jgi:hypothetical protein